MLDKRAGLSFANLDVFLNVVGGVRMQEPAGDLAVAAALASSVYDKILPADAVFIGEVGLGGEIRAVSQVERRIAEAEKMGMKVAYVGERSVPKRAPKAIRVEGVPSLTRSVQEIVPMSNRDVGVVIVAGGASTRTTGNQGQLKQLRWIAGKPMLLHSLQTFQQRSDVAMVVCVLPPSYAGDPPPWIFQCDVERMLISVGGKDRSEIGAERA